MHLFSLKIYSKLELCGPFKIEDLQSFTHFTDVKNAMEHETQPCFAYFVESICTVIDGWMDAAH